MRPATRNLRENPTTALDAKLLYRRLDSLLGSLDQTRPQAKIVRSFFENAFHTLRADLRLSAALLYGEGRDGFSLLGQVGETIAPRAEHLPADLPPLTRVFEHRVYIFSDPAAEGSPQALGLLPPRPAAALSVGRRPTRKVFFFMLAEGWVREELDFALNTVRAALGSRLKDERVRGRFRQASEIQQSLLLEEPPSFSGYDIACRSVPTEEVGGDFYDFLSLDQDLLGVAIGDASGHGLPAALQVRDVVTGLRMGIEKELKIAPAFARLNRVIHRSHLTSRFISVFYGELATNGNLIYVNAGHQPPLLFSSRGVERLEIGGTVIGPLPEVRFERGVIRMERPSALVLCTDGILERRGEGGEFFGEERLKQMVREQPALPAGDLLDRLFAAAWEFGGSHPWEDDATLVIVRRLA